MESRRKAREKDAIRCPKTLFFVDWRQFKKKSHPNQKLSEREVKRERDSREREVKREREPDL